MRKFLVALSVLTLCATTSACARQTSVSAPHPSEPTSAHAATTNFVSAGCMAPRPLGPFMKEAAAANRSLFVVAKAKLTGVTELRKDNGTPDAIPVVYTQIQLTVTRVIAGSDAPTDFLAYAVGGEFQDHKTETDTLLRSAWAADGSMFAELTPSDELRSSYAISALPILSDSVAFVGVGCQTAVGYATERASGDILVLENGSLVKERVSVDTVPLSVIEESAR